METASLDAGSLAAPVIELPPPPPPAPAPRRPPVSSPKPVATTPPQPEPPAPRMIQLLTPEQLRENTRILDESLDRVQRALDSLARKTLTAEQKDAMERIRDFQKQAKQAREQDLMTAVNLAKRADSLATDLLNRLP